MAAATCLGGAVVYGVIYPGCYRTWLAKRLRACASELGTRGVIGPIRLILGADSFVEITESTRSEARWRDMEGIEETDNYTFILVTGMTAAIIPRQAFKRVEDYYEVRDLARARLADGAKPAAGLGVGSRDVKEGQTRPAIEISRGR
jgi:hypothetical protein